jgi:hypothetical protein
VSTVGRFASSDHITLSEAGGHRGQIRNGFRHEPATDIFPDGLEVPEAGGAPSRPGGRGPGRFQPGKSGNPGGRPKEIGCVKELARVHTEEALTTLAAIMRDEKSLPAARVRAANASSIAAGAGPRNPSPAMVSSRRSGSSYRWKNPPRALRKPSTRRSRSGRSRNKSAGQGSVPAASLQEKACPGDHPFSEIWKTDAEPESQSNARTSQVTDKRVGELWPRLVSPAAERQRLCRERHRRGAMVVQVVISPATISNLARLGWLRDSDLADREAIRDAFIQFARCALGHA